MISEKDLEEKVKSFAERETNSLFYFPSINFKKEAFMLPMETEENNVIAAAFCHGYQSLQYLIALSAQSGCGVGCNFCDLSSYGMKEDLTDKQILDQITAVMKTANLFGYPLLDKPLKATFVNGGDPLDNEYMPRALERMSEEIPLKTKVSTAFPAAEKSLRIYDQIVDVAKTYPNIMQFQVSLNSTDDNYRQNLTKMPVADFKTIREAGEKWMTEVPDPRKVNLTFTLTGDTPMNPDHIKNILPPYMFAIRLRDYSPTRRGRRKGCTIIESKKLEETKKRFEDCGYLHIPGKVGHLERMFKTAPGGMEIIQAYKMFKH